MNKTGKAILYISGSIILLGGALALLLKKPKGDDKDKGDESTDKQPETKEQTQETQTTLNSMLRFPTASSTIKNKTIFSKIAGAKGRTEPYVNDGFISNENFVKYSTMGDIGKATGVLKEDKGKTKSPQGYVYKWVEIELSKTAVEEYNRNSPWYYPSAKAGQKTLMREDVIRL